MLQKVIFQDIGLIDYMEAWDYQESLHKRIVDEKTSNSSENQSNNTIIFCEHPHVYTLGKSGVANNLLINEDFLKKINASFYKTNRGGDITYHGPGQIVGYPIIDIQQLDIGVKDYVHLLEEVIIKTLSEYDIRADRLEGATGVWIEPKDNQNARKICAIGVRISRYVTMHGFALNVNTNLEYFTYINPCGFTSKGITSMQKEKAEKIDSNEVKSLLKRNLAKSLNVELIQD